MATETISSGDGTLIVTVDSRQAVRGLNDIEARMLSMSNNVNRGLAFAGSSFNKFVGIVKAAAGAFAAFVSVRTVTGWLSSLIGKIIEVDRSFRGFIASMGIIRGSTQAAIKEYEFLYAISNKLGVQVETSISQYHRLAAALKNVDSTGELARHLFSGLSQAAVVLHSKGRDVTLIFEAVQQMASKGKLSLEELQRQLGNTLPGAVATAAKAMMKSKDYIDAGITSVTAAEQKLRDQIAKGTINVYEFLTLLAQQLKEDYGQGVEYASKQFTANLARMRNSVFEFFRVVGNEGATAGLTKVVQEITRLFSMTTEGAADFGKALEKVFTDVATWISKLSADDIKEFFLAIQAVTLSTGIVLSEFIAIFDRFNSSEVNTPMLGFAEFIAKTMAATVDVFKVAADGIEAVVRSIMAVFLELRHAFSWAMEGIQGGLNAVAQKLPWTDKQQWQQSADDWKATNARWNTSAEQNAVAAGRAWKGFVIGSPDNAYNRVSAQFDSIRQNAPVRGRLPRSPHSRTPAALEDPSAPYTNPLGSDALAALVDRIKANSGAPNASGGGNGKKSKEAEAALRRSVREYEKMENAVSRWRGEAGITEKAEEKLRRATEELNEAVGKLDPTTGKLLITQTEADEIMAKLNEKYKEALNPISFLLNQYDEQAKALKYIGDEAKVYTDVLAQQEKWREGNVKFNEKDIEDLKEKIRLQQDLTRMQSQMDAVLGATVYKKRDDKERIQAVGQLARGYESPDGEMRKLTEGETATAVMDIFGQDRLEGTQEYYDAQLEIYQNFLEQVKTAQEEGLISDATARNLSMQGWSEYWSTRTQSTMDGLAILEGLMNTNSKKMFKIGQAAAIARATITGVEAAINAYNSGMQLGGPFGPAVGAVFMAASIATTAAQISKIRSQTPPGFEYGGSYKVGGGGGTDSKRITFDATPGEIINVNTPSQAKAMERIADDLENGSRNSPRVQNMDIKIIQQGRTDRKTAEHQARQLRIQAARLMEED